MPEREIKIPWYEQLGISGETISSQFPQLNFFRGEKEVHRQDNGQMTVVGSEQGVALIYRFNPETQTATLIYDRSGKESGTINKLKLNQNLPLKDILPGLAEAMEISPEEAASQFTESQGDEKVYLNLEAHTGKLSINFPADSGKGSLSRIYDYNPITNSLELVYKNDGKGNVWAKWNQRKTESSDVQP